LIVHLRFFTRLFVVLALLIAAPARSGEVPAARNLHSDGLIANQAGLPILLFYSASYCHYCEAIKAEFLSHMAVDPTYQTRALFREVRIDSSAPLVSFDERTTTHHRFAGARKITLVPTMEFVDASGASLAEPVIGARIPDYYGAYVDQGINDALKKIQNEHDPS
jgi:thioredoxin-related protein